MSKIVKEDPKKKGSKPIIKKEKTPPPPIPVEKEEEKTPPPSSKKGMFSFFKKKKNQEETGGEEVIEKEEVVVEEEEVIEETSGGEELESGEEEYEYYEIDENGNEIIVDQHGNPVNKKEEPKGEPISKVNRFSETPKVSNESGVFQGLACTMYEGLRNVAETMGIILYDETIEHLAWNICKMPSLEGFCLLLQTGIQLFSTFECNVQAGNAFRDRFYEVLKLFGHPKHGIVEYCLINGLTIENDLVYQLESVISSSLRYLSRFARPDHLIYTLVSEKPKVVLLHLNYEVDKITNDIIVGLKYKGPLSLSPMKNYNVACNIKSLV